jgi:hypothetical protein
MSKEKPQAAELRVALELDGKHALIAQANLKGGIFTAGRHRGQLRGRNGKLSAVLFMPAGRRDFTDSGSRL